VEPPSVIEQPFPGKAIVIYFACLFSISAFGKRSVPEPSIYNACKPKHCFVCNQTLSCVLLTVVQRHLPECLEATSK